MAALSDCQGYSQPAKTYSVLKNDVEAKTKRICSNIISLTPNGRSPTIGCTKND